MALFGTYATLRAQAPRTPGMRIAFDYVEDLLRANSAPQARLRAMGAGESQRHELADGVFVIEQVYAAKPRAEGFFESHRRYIDVQVVLEGAEIMEVADISALTVRQPYLSERDLITYDDTPHASVLRVLPGQGAVFYPEDVHMPSLRAGAEPTVVRKAVVKVPVANGATA